MIFQWEPSLFLSKADKELQYVDREKEIIQKFVSEVWNQYSNRQKIGTLQNLENIRAKKQERRPVNIREYNLKEFYGEYNGNENTMFINLNYSSYEVLDTYLHEARHAYQEKSVKKGEGYDEHSLNMIKAENAVDENGNPYNYIEDGVGYDTASCELDANNEAMRTMLSYSEEFESDPEYLNYLEERKNHFQDVNETLKEEREQRQEIQKEQAEQAYYRGDLSEEEYTEIKERVEENRMDRMEKDSPYIEKSLDYTKEHCEEAVCQELRERTTDSKEKFESEIYKKHPDKQKLNELRQDNKQNLQYIEQQQQRYANKENEKFDEIQKYVNENNLTPRECQNDEKYQHMIDEYSSVKEENASLKYQKEVLEEQNRQIDEVVTPKEEQQEKEQQKIGEQEEQGKNIARRLDEESEQTVKESELENNEETGIEETETENEEVGMEEITGEEETETENEEVGMEEITGEKETETENKEVGMEEITGEEETETENEEVGMEEITGEEETEIENEEMGMEEVTREEELETENEELGMEEITEEEIESETEEMGMEEITGEEEVEAENEEIAEDETEVESEEMETDSSSVDSSEGEDEDEEYTYSY